MVNVYTRRDVEAQNEYELTIQPNPYTSSSILSSNTPKTFHRPNFLQHEYDLQYIDHHKLTVQKVHNATSNSQYIPTEIPWFPLRFLAMID